VAVIVVIVVCTGQDERADFVLIPLHLEYDLAEERLTTKVAVSHTDEIPMATELFLGVETRW
jgi:hypothetical protein